MVFSISGSVIAEPYLALIDLGLSTKLLSGDVSPDSPSIDWVRPRVVGCGASAVTGMRLGFVDY